MKTVILEQPGRFRLTDTAAPARPGPGEALVRVRRIGVCGTDLHAFRGKQPFFTYPRILGHERGVEVVSAPANGCGIRPGQRCAVEPYTSCGACVARRRGKAHCRVNLCAEASAPDHRSARLWLAAKQGCASPYALRLSHSPSSRIPISPI